MDEAFIPLDDALGTCPVEINVDVSGSCPLDLVSMSLESTTKRHYVSHSSCRLTQSLRKFNAA